MTERQAEGAVQRSPGSSRGFRAQEEESGAPLRGALGLTVKLPRILVSLRPPLRLRVSAVAL